MDELLAHGKKAKRVDAWSEDWVTNLEAAVVEGRDEMEDLRREKQERVLLGDPERGDAGEVPREKEALRPTKGKSKKDVNAEGARSSAVRNMTRSSVALVWTQGRSSGAR